MGIADLTYPEVDFRKTALKTVVCQLRFDPYLRIAVEPPVKFQEKLRATFPKLGREEQLMGLRLELEGADVRAIDEPVPPEQMAIWRFRSQDDSWVAGLASSFVSLEATAYSDFKAFEERLGLLNAAMAAAYPAIEQYTRVGLRYINVFSPDLFADGDLRLRFNSQLLGPAADPILGPSVKTAQQMFVLAEGDWTISVRHGVDEEGNYRLDLDHATISKVPTGDVLSRLGEFNRRTYQVFRWALSEALYEEMEPVARDE